MSTDARKAVRSSVNLSPLVIFLMLCNSASGQLVECDQVNEGGAVNAPGGCIDRSLLDQIGPGQGDVNTFGASIYVIKRDPARSIRRGRQLFQRKFSRAEGQGPVLVFHRLGILPLIVLLAQGWRSH